MSGDAMLKKSLKVFLQRLIEGIETGYRVADVTWRISSENDLQRFVYNNASEDATLFRLLGYDEASIDDHPSIHYIGTSRYVPDYVLRHQQKAIAIVDLKKPEENLDSPSWAAQVLSYCNFAKAPLGLLFNGRGLRVFVFADHPLLKFRDRSEIAFDKPIASADSPNFDRVAELLSLFAFDYLSVRSIAISKKLVKEHADIIHNAKRQEKIREILCRYFLKSAPDNIRHIFMVLPEIDLLWSEMEPKPTADELMTAWGLKVSQHSIDKKPVKRAGVNPALRAKIAEVCEKKGWEAIKKAGIRGLNWRTERDGLNGFRLVPPGPGVPDGLCIQGESSVVIQRIMRELDNILSVGS